MQDLFGFRSRKIRVGTYIDAALYPFRAGIGTLAIIDDFSAPNLIRISIRTHNFPNDTCLLSYDVVEHWDLNTLEEEIGLAAGSYFASLTEEVPSNIVLGDN